MDRSKVCIKNGWLALGIAIGLAALAVVVMAGGAGALSNDGGGSWQYYRDLTITNPGAELTYFQLLVNLTCDAFPTGAETDGAARK